MPVLGMLKLWYLLIITLATEILKGWPAIVVAKILYSSSQQMVVQKFSHEPYNNATPNDRLQRSQQK